ncbi:DNA-directed RNA polymerases II, IV and V subunit 12 isoform X1 [Actinidia eriantha]|uniref:DNA-directed RNA polymerases II, IV and V subunit 12 isoform X1 n=1 Tax=Actinidia eriantha TaxID=165200 RepID=UPI00259087DC|nr:DNA-directed RNA polymerases II, IV and V subunit 12 isoform X1 [Actinidia eriantha]
MKLSLSQCRHRVLNFIIHGSSTRTSELYLWRFAFCCFDCGQENTLKPGDVIQCRECGYRILYKKRTRRIVQYEAR